MRRKITRVLPVLISLILAFSIVAIAWVIQESYIRGVYISSVSDGVEVKLKIRGGAEDFTTDLNLNAADLQLRPCVYTPENQQFSDENWNYVTQNEEFVKTYELMIRPSETCRIIGAKTVTGDLPIGVVIDGVELTEEGVDIGVIGTPYKIVTLQFYIDGNLATANGTGNVQITLRGE